ncbi:MAG: 4-hydroxy-tetrahydrodipicolinate reductase [Candidatus Omnitrophica bacterium]|nr:4-hydroxy-tetrahydrodipicolinate reductase [Candidatus Omnitrophota bacterium]
MRLRLAVSGCRGRMGQRILELAARDGRFDVKAALERPGHPEIGQRIRLGDGAAARSVLVYGGIEESLQDADCLIEFTTPEATSEHLEWAVRLGRAMVIGTTGLTEEMCRKIRKAGDKIPVVQSPNMSVGVNLLFALTERASRTLPPDYGVRMVEAHHKNKKDAPSGTAKQLAAIVRKERGVDTPIQSIREGEIVGEHTVTFANAVEVLQFEHEAQSRDAFAQGALVAALFLQGKKKGFFDMLDVLGLRS